MFLSIDAWFKENLPEPEPCKNQERVITFFKCGNTVGTIVYEDDWQIAVSVNDGKMI